MLQREEVNSMSAKITIETTTKRGKTKSQTWEVRDFYAGVMEALLEGIQEREEYIEHLQNRQEELKAEARLPKKDEAE